MGAYNYLCVGAYNCTVSKKTKKQTKKHASKFEFTQAGDLEYCFSLMQRLIENEFDLKSEDESITAHGHVTITIPKTGDIVVLSLGTSDL